MSVPAPGVFKVPNVASQDLLKIVLTNSDMYIEIINPGASLYGIYLPSGNETFVNVVLNYPDIADYFTDNFYIGATVGRVAGRIKNGQLPINGELFQLSKNEKARHHLHGGYQGFNKKVFQIYNFEHTDTASSVTLFTQSADGEEGYPGNLRLWVTYTLQHNNQLTITYRAASDFPTHVNLTNHSYFNLCGKNAAALNQQLQINALEILEIDHFFIPTGKKLQVRNTEYDFGTEVSIREQKARLPRTFYNDCYLLPGSEKPGAVLADPASGRRMEMRTTYPSILFYSGDFLAMPFAPCEGICLEAQFIPDAPNQELDCTTLLNAGEEYLQQISFRFSW